METDFGSDFAGTLDPGLLEVVVVVGLEPDLLELIRPHPRDSFILLTIESKTLREHEGIWGWLRALVTRNLRATVAQKQRPRRWPPGRPLQAPHLAPAVVTFCHGSVLPGKVLIIGLELRAQTTLRGLVQRVALVASPGSPVRAAKVGNLKQIWNS